MPPVQAFSLGAEATRYLEGVPKGHKSKVVNRAILFYKDNGAIMASRDKLQQIVLELTAEKEENDPPSRGWRHRFNPLNWFNR